MLSESVLEIAEGMDALSKDLNPDIPHRVHLAMFSQMLRIAVKASEGSSPPLSAAAPIMDARSQHRIEIEKAKAEFRRQRQSTETQEELEPRMTTLVGGRSDGTIVPFAPTVTVGWETVVGGQVYVLAEDGSAHYDMQKTVEMKTRQEMGKKE